MKYVCIYIYNYKGLVNPPNPVTLQWLFPHLQTSIKQLNHKNCDEKLVPVECHFLSDSNRESGSTVFNLDLFPPATYNKRPAKQS